MSCSSVLGHFDVKVGNLAFFPNISIFFQTKNTTLFNTYLSITSEKIIKIKVETVELCLIEVEILPKNGQLKVENFRPFRIDCFVTNTPCYHILFLLQSVRKTPKYHFHEDFNILHH